MRWIEFTEFKITYEATQAWSGTGRGFFDQRKGVRLHRMETSMFGRYGWCTGKATPAGLRALCDEMAYDLDEYLKMEALIAAHLDAAQPVEPEWEGMSEHLEERVHAGAFDQYECSDDCSKRAALLDEVVVVVERGNVWAATVYPDAESAWAAFDALSAEVHAADTNVGA